MMKNVCRSILTSACIVAAVAAYWALYAARWWAPIAAHGAVAVVILVAALYWTDEEGRKCRWVARIWYSCLGLFLLAWFASPNICFDGRRNGGIHVV